MAYITEDDLRAALAPGVFSHVFDDNNDGLILAGQTNVVLVIERAHIEVLSYLPALYTTLPSDALPEEIPKLLKSVELDFAIAFALERRPELSASLGASAETYWKRAEAKMIRITESVQRITDVASLPQAKNLGGVVLSGDPNAPDILHPFFKNGIGDF